jgi:hypothetical protein
MVPMALGMLFIPLSIFLAFNIKKWPSYLLIFLFISLLLISHAATALVLCIILAPCVLLNIKDNRWHSAGVFAALALPFVLSLPWTFRVAAQTASQVLMPQYFSPYIELPDLLWKYGLLPIAFSFIGIVILIIKGSKKGLALILGLALLLVVMLVFIRFHHGLSTVYERGLTAMLLVMSILAGAGFLWLRNMRLPVGFLGKNKSSLFTNVANIACVILAVVILVIAIPTRANAVFYHMINDEDYQSFVWIKNYINADYTSGLVDPWKATAFTALTGKKVLHRIWVSQEQLDNAIYQFLANGCPDTSFFIENRLSFVYSQMPCINENLVKVRNNVYVINPFDLIIFSPAGANELHNPGFEPVYGCPPPFWSQLSQYCDPSFKCGEPGRNGGTSLAIQLLQIKSFDPWPYAMWLQNVPVQAGKSYIISGWIKTEDVEGQGGALIAAHWKDHHQTWIGATYFMQFVKGTTGWTYYQGNVTPPPGATIGTFCCMMSGCSGTAWYDDASFKEQ